MGFSEWLWQPRDPSEAPFWAAVVVVLLRVRV